MQVVVIKSPKFLAGILRRIPEITVFADPLPGSYERLGRCEAPGVVSWSCQNRSSLVRVPAASGPDCRMELRSPDPSCNPYYVTALLLAAGFEGVQEGLNLPAAADDDAFARPAGLTPLPASLDEALALARESEFLKQVLPEKLLVDYLGHKQREADAYAAESKPYEYEIRQYFERI